MCGQAHAVGEPHKFGKAADVRRDRQAGLTPEAIETLSSAFMSDEGSDIAPAPIGASVRRPGRPKYKK